MVIPLFSQRFSANFPHAISTDYEGFGSYDANTMAVESQVTKIFQNYYPEFFVRVLVLHIGVPAHPFPAQDALHQRFDACELGNPVRQAVDPCQHAGEDKRCW